jgi:hypothetical protein
MNKLKIGKLGIACLALWGALALSACGGPQGADGDGVESVTSAQTLYAPSNLLGMYNENLWSDNNQYRLSMQSDCNLVLYEVYGTGWRAVWASNTAGRGTNCYAVMQTDGNLVVYSGTKKVIWSPNTWGHPGAHLVMQNDRNAVIYDANGRALWSTNTWIRPPVTCSNGIPVGCNIDYPSCYFTQCSDGKITYYNCGNCR